MRSVGIGIEPMDALAKFTLYNYTVLDGSCKEIPQKVNQFAP